MDQAELAYLAGVVDALAIIRERPYGRTVLPMVAVHGQVSAPMRLLASRTGTRITVTRRDFTRAGCAEHCPERHQHVVSESGRWSVSGTRATILLSAIRPYLQVQTYAADEAIELGLSVHRKPAVAEKMAGLGWPLPVAWSSSLALVT